MWFNAHIALQGIISGLIMGTFAMTMNMLKVTSLNLTEYMGCLITGKKSGPASFIAGFGAHIVASALIAMIYINIIIHFQLSMDLKTTLLLAAGHTVIAGIMMSMMDTFNPCVSTNKIRAMQLFALGHGNNGMIIYIAAHFLYTILFMYLIGAHMSWSTPKVVF